MNNSEIKKVRDKIVEGMKISSEKFISLKKQLRHRIVISDNGEIIYIDAQDLT